MKTYLAAKIHNLRVTAKQLNYFGSVTVDRQLLEAAGIEPYEQVHVINLESGARWVTYALPGKDGQFRLNGGGARLGEVGDRCVLLSFRMAEAFQRATVIYCTSGNMIEATFTYDKEEGLS